MATSTDIEVPAVSTPRFETEANRFALAMMNYSTSEVAQIMHCSTSIAATTRNRFANFFNDEEKLPAILAYTGQAYRGLRADTLNHQDMLFAQEHLHITSFLYGLLRPLDRIHPYRMEGNVELEPAGGINMFAFWRSRLTQCLIDAVKADDGVLMHLATEEMEHPIRSLSGGQKAKLLLLKLKQQRADVLLLDEPTRNFSPLSGPVVRELIASFGGAVISISHDRKYIYEVCDRVLRLTPRGLVPVYDFEEDMER